MTVAEATELIQAVSGFAWPAAGLVIAVLFRKFIAQMLARENVSIKIAGMEVSVADAAKQTGSALSDVIERVARLEGALADGEGGQGPKVDGEPDRAAPSSSQRASVLWVDDFPSNNAFLIQGFEEEGIRVRKELSTKSGLFALANERFNAIITDLGRKEDGTDNPFAGLDFIEAVRSSGCPTPILVFAGRRGLENRERLLSAGATEVTASPVEVFRFVHEHLA